MVIVVALQVVVVLAHTNFSPRHISTMDPTREDSSESSDVLPGAHSLTPSQEDEPCTIPPPDEDSPASAGRGLHGTAVHSRACKNQHPQQGASTIDDGVKSWRPAVTKSTGAGTATTPTLRPARCVRYTIIQNTVFPYLCKPCRTHTSSTARRSPRWSARCARCVSPSAAPVQHATSPLVNTRAYAAVFLTTTSPSSSFTATLAASAGSAVLTIFSTAPPVVAATTSTCGCDGVMV